MDPILVIEATESAERIDALLARSVERLTRSAAQRLLEQGAVTLAGRPVKKNYKPAPGERLLVTLPEPEPAEPEPEDIPLDVRYEDEDLIVVNKPRGMVVHPAPGAKIGPASSTASTRTRRGCSSRRRTTLRISRSRRSCRTTASHARTRPS